MRKWFGALHGGGEAVFTEQTIVRLGLGYTARGPHVQLGLAIQF